ncbi:hypothetical protein AB834_07285 [PVC group bacterium (ex Bugula neritina AB1)]|nr:hypothetical protein AB834_07285 [PVC group bacterium (ex Bugula neritina AB1)]
MKILMVSSECYPYAKTGGMADVVGDLVKSLTSMGHEVSVILPFYRDVKNYLNLENINIDKINISIDMKTDSFLFEGSVLKWEVNGCCFYAIQNDRFFDRDFLYGDSGGDYFDNSKRFAFFCQGVVRFIDSFSDYFDIVHCHDWQTGLVPVWLKKGIDTLWGKRRSAFSCRTLLTIHNLAYQGVFDRQEMNFINEKKPFYDYLQMNGKVNFLKGGLLGADSISTVSPQYVKEIQEKALGHGLHRIMILRSQNLWGILNGIDIEHWDSQKDIWITKNFDKDSLSNKEENKNCLYEKMNWEKSDDLLLGMVCRLVTHKGLDLLEEGFDRLMSLSIRFILIGTGDAYWCDFFKRMEKKYHNFRCFLSYEDRLAHQLYSSIDGFLMPSKFEPCGLTQMIAMRYGAIPLVHKIGGLANTVEHWSEKDQSSKGKGFVMQKYDVEDLLINIENMLLLYQDKRKWEVLVRKNMSLDFSWKSAAQKYLALYRYLVTITP